MKNRFLLISASILLASGIAQAQLYPQHQNRGVARAIQLEKQELPASRVSASESIIYSEDFENYNIGTSPSLPVGWEVYDNSPSSTAGWGLTGDRKHSGNLAFVSGYDMNAPRDAWAFSPAITLEAGTTYYFSIWNFAPGYDGRFDEWQLTIGQGQDAKSQNNVVIDFTGDKSKSLMEWTNFVGRFTPETSGDYNIGIHHCTSVADCNQVLWDLLEVDTSPIKILPEGQMYSVGGLWSYYQFIIDEETGEKIPPRVYTYRDEVFTYGYHAKNCDSVEWILDEYAVIDDVYAHNPSVKFEFPDGESVVETGNMLIMKNADGEAYSTREYFHMFRIQERDNFSDWIGNFKPEDLMWAYASSVENEYDALTGISEKYSSIAELYIRPNNTKVAVQGAIIPFTLYRMSPMNINKSITVRLRLADAQRRPGEEVYSQSYSMKDLLGNLEMIDRVGSANVAFEEAIDIVGSFFVEVEFPDVTPSEENSLFLVNCGVREHEDYSTFYYARGNDELAEGWYNSVEMYGYNIATGIFPLTLFYNVASVEAPTADTGHIYAEGKNVCVLNATIGSDIYVTDITGRLVHTAQVTALKTIVSTQLNAGIYIVTVDGKSQKIVIR